jgi:hypothetical protein
VAATDTAVACPTGTVPGVAETLVTWGLWLLGGVHSVLTPTANVKVLESPSAFVTVIVTVGESPAATHAGAVQVTSLAVPVWVGVPSAPVLACHAKLSELPCGSVATTLKVTLAPPATVTGWGVALITTGGWAGAGGTVTHSANEPVPVPPCPSLTCTVSVQFGHAPPGAAVGVNCGDAVDTPVHVPAQLALHA